MVNCVKLFAIATLGLAAYASAASELDNEGGGGLRGVVVADDHHCHCGHGWRYKKDPCQQNNDHTCYPMVRDNGKPLIHFWQNGVCPAGTTDCHADKR